MSETRSIEEAPSEVRTEDLGVTQVAGLTGMGVATLGVIVVIANQFGPRIFSASYGYLFASFGLAGMFYHALRDGTIEVRRGYLFFSVGLIVAALIASIIPGPLMGGGEKSAGHHFLPWTPLLAIIGLTFLTTALRHETNEKFTVYGLTLLVVIGASLCAGVVAVGMVRPESLAGPGILLGLVGIGFMVAYVSRVDTSDGTGYLIATLLGILGAVALVYAMGRSIFPQLVYEGPPGLLNAYQRLDTWKVLARVAEVLACLGFAWWCLRNTSLPVLMRYGLAVLAVGCALVFVYASFVTTAILQPKPYLVPSGLLLGFLGAVYLTISLGLVSDSQLVTLTRRELGSIFHSPIAYLVLISMTLVMFLGYIMFLQAISEHAATEPEISEPVVRFFFPLSFFGPIAAMIFVPALTMRCFSEDKRSNTIEVLLTAPVSEWNIVLSKFFSCWILYLLIWIPAGIYLIVFRVAGDSPFDYKPVLSAACAIAVTGWGFISMGVFCSSLTKNQIIAALMTFGGMFFLWLLHWSQHIGVPGSPVIKQIVEALSVANYSETWAQALRGQLAVKDMIFYVTKAIFWLYLTTKVLEARKWG